MRENCSSSGKQAVHPREKFKERVSVIRKLNEVYRKKAKQKAISTLQKIKRNRKMADDNQNYGKKNKIVSKVEITGERKQYPKQKKELREKRLARGNSASVKTSFRIDPEECVDKPLIFDQRQTGEEEIFDWLLSNISAE